MLLSESALVQGSEGSHLGSLFFESSSPTTTGLHPTTPPHYQQNKALHCHLKLIISIQSIWNDGAGAVIYFPLFLRISKDDSLLSVLHCFG
jgi:hypothetical protein